MLQLLLKSNRATKPFLVGRNLASTLAQAPANSSTLNIEAVNRRSLPIIHDTFTTTNANLLSDALEDFLPPAVVQTAGNGSLDLRPGYHLVYFPTRARNSDLLPDGTDKWHVPDKQWQYRLWAGGQIRFMEQRPLRLDGLNYVLKEKLKISRLTGGPEPDKVFLDVSRSIGLQAMSDSSKRLSIPDASQNNSIIHETRQLCFLKTPPKSLSGKHATRGRPPPTDPYYKHSLTPNAALLFRFSALTYNAHAIHLDREYARHEYGAPNLVVHGPLALVLIFEVFDRALSKYCAEKGKLRYAIRTIDYRNVAPLFVDEEMTICCKHIQDIPISEHPYCNPTQEWLVWIQKGQGTDSMVAVKGTIIVHEEVQIESPTSFRRKET